MTWSPDPETNHRRRLDLATAILTQLELAEKTVQPGDGPVSSRLAAVEKFRKYNTLEPSEFDAVRAAARWTRDAALALCDALAPAPSTSSASFSPSFSPFPPRDSTDLLPGVRSPTPPYDLPPPPPPATGQQEEKQPVPAASLGGLPPELKALIVEKIAEFAFDVDDDGDDFEDEDSDTGDFSAKSFSENRSSSSSSVNAWGTGTVKESEAKLWDRAPLAAISLVNRDFAALAQPYLFRDLDLVDSTNPEIAYFLCHILPRQGHHVQRLSLGHSFGNAQVDNLPFGEPVLQLRQALLALILLLLPNLHVVATDFTDKPRRPPDIPLTADDWAFRVSLVTEVLRLRGPGISDLTLVVTDRITTADEGYIGTFLQAFPILERFSYEGVEDVASSGRKTLVAAIASQPRLTTLSLDGAAWAGEELADATWASSLKILALMDCPSVSLPSFISLVRKHASTLEVVELRDVPSVNNRRDNKNYLGKPLPFSLPKLDTLVLSTEHERGLLDLFARCPLSTVEIGWTPAIPYAAWEKFVVHHARTLKMLSVEAGVMTDAQRESFEVLCHAKNIMCTVDTDDEDDSDGTYGDEEEPYDWEDYDSDDDDDDEEHDDDQAEIF